MRRHIMPTIASFIHPVTDTSSFFTQGNTVVMLCVMADELSIPITVDEYTKQLRELQAMHFPEAELLPGMLCFIIIIYSAIRQQSDKCT